MKLALIGAGQRGMIYAEYAHRTQKAEIVAVVEPNMERRHAAGEKLEVSTDQLYTSVDEFYQQGKIADGLIIASMDRDHYEQTMKALDLGYHILLEKPISPNPKECLEIQKKANEKQLKVIVCHVLRYTNFFSTIKEIIDSKELGKVITIQHNENIGNFHIAHSFVRGNWRRSDLASPLIMQKSCHDMDILAWLVDSEPKYISSYGSLTYFKEENAPKGSTDRCLTCPVAEKCRFDARKAYLPVAGVWPATLVTPETEKESVLKALETSPYGRCVYRCDNDVCDNQVAIIQFKNGVTVSFNLSGFTNKMSRTIKIMCEDGEIRGDDSTNTIEITKFNSNHMDRVEKKVIHPGIVEGFHGGGDVGLMRDFLQLFEDAEIKSRSSIDQSVESHIMACAAEEARLTGKVVDLDEMKVRLMSQSQK